MRVLPLFLHSKDGSCISRFISLCVLIQPRETTGLFSVFTLTSRGLTPCLAMVGAQ